mgnify:FL=1
MSTNIKVAIATGDAVLKYVDTDTTVGSNGGGSSPTPTVTRIIAIHALATAAGLYTVKGQRQITNKTAEGQAIQFQVAANEASDIYMGELGVPVYGVVSVSRPTDGCVLTAILG